MERSYKILGISKETTIEEVKKCYYKKIKEFPPEQDGNKFIEITKAYEDIEKYLLREKSKSIMIKVYVENIRIAGLVGDINVFYNNCNDLVEVINKRNFKEISDQIIDLIISFNKKGDKLYAYKMANIFSDGFNRNELLNLGDSYSLLANNLIEINRGKENE